MKAALIIDMPECCHDANFGLQKRQTQDIGMAAQKNI